MRGIKPLIRTTALIAATIMALGCSPYRRIETLEAERQQRVEETRASMDRASRLALRASEAYSRSPRDSGRYAANLWSSAAALYGTAGESKLAAVMLNNAAAAYQTHGDSIRALAYRELGSRFSATSSAVIVAAAANVPSYVSPLVTRFDYPFEHRMFAADVYGLDAWWWTGSQGGSSSAQLKTIASLYAQLGRRDSALAYYGSSALAAGNQQFLEIAEIIRRSPLLDSSALRGDTNVFIREANTIVERIVGTALAWTKAASVVRATADLEALLALRRVPAVITSNPTRIVVRYWPLTGDSLQGRDATTADTVLIRPAAYVFTAQVRNAEWVERRRVNCATGCRVHFELQAK